MLRIID